MAEIYLRQELKLTQKLVMTQQLQLAIKLLQMNRLEIEQAIQEQLTENPCLEEDQPPAPPEPSSAPETQAEGRKPSLEDLDQNLGSGASGTAKDGDGSAGETDTFNWDRFLDNYESFRDGGPAPRGPDDDAPTFEQFVAAPTTLQDHLLWQLRLSDFAELEVDVGAELIGNIDDRGYLRDEGEEDILDLVSQRSGAPRAFIEGVLERVQLFDPVGVGARNLAECLLVQAKHYYPDEPLLARMIEDHLVDLEHKRAKRIGSALGVTVDEVVRLAGLLASLEPRPGRGFGGPLNPYIVPDVQVRKIDGEYVVLLNDDGLTRLKISGYYRRGLKGGDRTAKEFIKKRLDAAMWFIKSIDQRQQTIRKVAESIVRFQRDFLENGPEHLRPLVLRDIASDIGMHESTVSRVSSNKYMHTPQGICPMKYFFNSRIERDGSPDLASEAVKRKIRKLVEAEDSRKPLSDQAIAKALAAMEGIRIARRTVAKYREQLAIPSSSERKQLA